MAMISEQVPMIYLAAQRGCTQSDWFCTYHSLNFGSYFNRHRAPFHQLNALNDETLKASHTISHPSVENSSVVLLPVVGGVEYAVDENEKTFVEAGESVFVAVPAGSILHITNPYDYELVNYLHVWFAGREQQPGYAKSTFDLPGHQNNFITLFEYGETRVHLGRFSARVDSVFHSTRDVSYVFAYVLEGAFEYENRLLEARDGLALSRVCVSEFEALSNDAIVLILEV